MLRDVRPWPFSPTLSLPLLLRTIDRCVQLQPKTGREGCCVEIIQVRFDRSLVHSCAFHSFVYIHKGTSRLSFETSLSKESKMQSHAIW